MDKETDFLKLASNNKALKNSFHWLILSLNYDMLKSTKNGIVSNFQRLSNSADFRKNVNKAYKTEDFL